MSCVIVTGSAGLVGSECVRFFAGKGFDVIGVDNDMRRAFFGSAASTAWRRRELERTLPSYTHYTEDIRGREAIERLFASRGMSIDAVIHTAAQPSHDWAASDPHADFAVNALGTLTLLEAARKHCPTAPFVFFSTNKVYGDAPNRLPLVREGTRWEVDPTHPFRRGIDESMSIDHTMHSVFGASKVAADVMVQEYGRYFGMYTVCFRGGCLTGPGQSPSQQHGFLAYLAASAKAGREYTIFGYEGRQVRDNIHSRDLAEAVWQFVRAPRVGAVYNIGGGRKSNCSVLEALALCEDILGRSVARTYIDTPRVGDHIWWISDMTRFKEHYPEWTQKYDVRMILEELLA